MKYLMLISLCLSLTVLAYPEEWQTIEAVTIKHNQVLPEPFKINLNSADKTTLEKITGIGPKKAQAIIDFRAQNGHFKKVTDLEKIKGFSKKIVAKLIETNKGVITLE